MTSSMGVQGGGGMLRTCGPTKRLFSDQPVRHRRSSAARTQYAHARCLDARSRLQSNGVAAARGDDRVGLEADHELAAPPPGQARVKSRTRDAVRPVAIDKRGRNSIQTGVAQELSRAPNGPSNGLPHGC
ncbi:hypothetical protein Trco_005983 [Trichoderma cornu-damae]|uniref:Uncharacterized protein n=1 Tax=Trichoderma cornu-damae TaxID=654480 RepID=A0A9P8QI90_9HYPO|nr:hypothetical protein Trco_005983 [Trichoderma cornu-damae]